MKRSGIYICICLINDGIYIGQTGSSYGFINRWKQEKSDLRNNRCFNLHWQRAWNKYGEENFEFRIIEECSDDVLNQREISWIKYYRNLNKNVYNFENGGNKPPSFKGKHHSEETKRKMSLAKKGKKFTEEHKKNISLTRDHSPIPFLRKLKISFGNTGKIRSKDAKEKYKNRMLGSKLSEETKRKMSLAKKGKSWTIARINAQKNRSV